MTEEQYQQWKADPLTVLFHKFLGDYRQSLMEKWATGGLQDKEEMLGMGRCQLAADLIELDDDFIQTFYRQPPKVEKEDSE